MTHSKCDSMSQSELHLASQTTDNSDDSDTCETPRSSSVCSGCPDCAGQADASANGHGCYGVGSFNEHSVSFVDGVCCEPLEHLIGMHSLMGLPSGLVFDTQVVTHGFGRGPEVLVEIHAQDGC